MGTLAQALVAAGAGRAQRSSIVLLLPRRPFLAAAHPEGGVEALRLGGGHVGLEVDGDHACDRTAGGGRRAQAGVGGGGTKTSTQPQKYMMGGKC